MTRKILYVVNVDWFFLSHRLPIALAAKELGYEVHIATGLTNKLATLQGYGFFVHPLQLDRGSTGLSDTLRTFLQILKLFKRVKPDITHLVTIKPVLLGGIAARIAHVPAVVAAVSGLGFVFVAQGFSARLRRGAVGLLYRLAMGHSNLRVIFQNDDDRASLVALANLPAHKTIMIRGSGVDLNLYAVTPEPSGRPIVAMAARLLIDKGVREFVEAARLLRCSLGEECARFVLVGEPDADNPASLSREELRNWIAEGTIEHWGYRADMPAVLAAVSIVALPSYYGEGLPKGLIEAAACGRPIVTTDHPGCRDAVQRDKTGILVKVRDARALAQAISELLLDPPRRKEMGVAGREFAEREFDVKQVVAAHLDIYARLADRT